MGQLIDLSHNIRDNMPVHPYDDRVILHQDKFLEVDKYNDFKLGIGMHIGTHIDTPMHMTDTKNFIDGISIDRFIGRATLLDVRGEALIEYKEEYLEIIREGDIILLFTGYSHKYGSELYFKEHPVISKELADFFVERKIKMLGIDLPSPDTYPFDIHKILFANGIFIIENMTNLLELLSIESFEIIALPLKVRADSAPVRVIAREL